MKTGQMVMTRGIADKIAESERFALEVNLSIGLYLKGNWGVVSDEDKAANDEDLKNNTGRIMGAYKTSEGRIWIMTEHDRSVTTILFPDEY